MRLLTSNKSESISFLLLGLCLGIHIFLSVSQTPLIGDDAYLHLSWLEDYATLRGQGINIPHWLPQTYGGIGSPTFYFYPPLTYLIGDVFYSLGFARSGTALFHAVNVSTLAISFITFFLYVRNRGFAHSHCLLGSLLYSFASYRYVDTFTRAALPEHIAFAWIPLVFLAIDIADRSRSSSDNVLSIVVGTIGIGLILLTNIPSAALLALIGILYGIGLTGRRYKNLWPVAVAAILAALSCAFYIVPLLYFREHIQISRLWGFDVFGSEWHHFLYEIFAPGARKSAIQISALFTFTLSLLALWMLLKRESRFVKKSRLARATALLLLAGILLQLPFVSDPVWDLLKPLQLLQFSWRLSIGLVFAFGVAVVIGLHHRSKMASYLGLACSVISLFFYVRYLYIALSFPPPPYMVEPVRKGAPEYTNHYVDLPRDSLRTWAIGLIGQPLYSSPQGMTVREQLATADTLEATIESNVQFDLHIKRLWWPQWRLLDNGVEIPIAPDSNGLMIARGLAAGDHRLVLGIAKSPAERTGEMLSLFGVGIFSALCIAGIALTRKKA